MHRLHVLPQVGADDGRPPSSSAPGPNGPQSVAEELDKVVRQILEGLTSEVNIKFMLTALQGIIQATRAQAGTAPQTRDRWCPFERRADGFYLQDRRIPDKPITRVLLWAHHLGPTRERMYQICKPLEDQIRPRWGEITGDYQGELVPPYHLFLTLQMQPSQAHAPPSWFFADLRGRTLYSVLDRLVDNAHPISLDSYLRTCAYDLTKALNQVLRKNCWEFVTDIYHLFDPDFNPKSLFSLTGVPLCIRQH